MSTNMPTFLRMSYFLQYYENYGGVKNERSRLFINPERFGNDNEEEMHKNFRLGWFYENAILENKLLRLIENKKEIRYA